MAPGSSYKITDVWVEVDRTSPPDYLKESELVAMMDKQGIGTDASIPQHIQNICDRNYVIVCGPGQNMHVTSKKNQRRIDESAHVD